MAGCTNEVVSDLLLFHENNSFIVPMWSVENSFTSRFSTRVGSKRHAEMIYMLIMILPGTSIFYYGSELGLEDNRNNMVCFNKKLKNFLEFSTKRFYALE